jgi:hypothetical protein
MIIDQDRIDAPSLKDFYGINRQNQSMKVFNTHEKSHVSAVKLLSYIL